jgi:DNA ligase-1
MKLPTLYKKTSKGAVQIWEVEVTDNVITVTHGQQDGKKQINSETIAVGKNIGKANETSPAQQAEAEAKAQWTKKQERSGYKLTVEDLEKVSDIGGPVTLAHKYSEHADKMPDNCYSQPKLDGHRCKAVIFDGICTLYSRTNTVIKGVPHINRFLVEHFHNAILDGELYNHDYRDKFEELTSFIRQDVPKPGHEVVQYHIYDFMLLNGVDGTKTIYDLRLGELIEAFDGLDTQNILVVVPTWNCLSFLDVTRTFKDFRLQGYEGSMLRNPDMVYENKRSYGLLKVKEMDDSEFTVVGITEGRGKLAGHAILTCKLEDSDATFDVKMKGNLATLKEIFENPTKYIGRRVTVQYQGFTKYNKPRFPVGLRFREDI